MTTTEIIVSMTIKMLDKQLENHDKGSDSSIRNRAAYYALKHLKEWGLDSKLIDKAAYWQTEPLSAQTVVDWLDEEALTSEDFYNAAFDFADEHA